LLWIELHFDSSTAFFLWEIFHQRVFPQAAHVSYQCLSKLGSSSLQIRHRGDSLLSTKNDDGDDDDDD